MSGAHRAIAGVAMALAWLAADVAAAQVVTAPAGAASVEGNGNSRFPFDPDVGQQPVEMRYQQVFAASEFNAVAPPFPIARLRFRADAGQEGQNGLSGTLTSLEIRLSTTSRDPDQLSATFSQNVGSGQQLVFSGAISFSPTPSDPPGPAPFSIDIPLQTAFAYDPRQGNLLLDVRNRSDGVVGAVDAELEMGDGVSRVFAFDADASAADTVDSLGLVVRFAPEPGAGGAALASALALFALAGRRRRGWWVAWDSNPEPTG